MLVKAPALLITLSLLAIFLLSSISLSQAANFQTERQSVTGSGAEVFGASMMPIVSGNGRYVVYASDAANVVPNNTPNRDIFLRDRQTGAVELISVAHDGTEADGWSVFPGISADGRYVVFEAQAGDIVDDDDQNLADIYVRDRQTGATRRVNLTPEGDDANDDSLTPSISSDGRYVTFTSQATNILPTDLNQERDVFLIDLQTNETELISISSDGTQGDFDSGHFGAGEGRVSGDGRYVVYGSFATNLVPNDTNDHDDIFVRDRLKGTTERVSLATDGTEGDDHSIYPSISDDGRYVAYYSIATTLVPDDQNSQPDVFLFDRQTHTTTRVSGGTGKDEANGRSRFPDISDDGRYVVFQSEASNLVPDDDNGSADIFRYEIASGETERISVPNGGGEGHGHSTTPSISGDGTVIAYVSLAEDIVAGDDNGDPDIFSWGKPLGIATPTPIRTPSATPTPQACPSERGDVNGDGIANSIDAALILQYGAGLLRSISPNADVNHDGSVNSIDAALILQYTAGIVTCLPP
jgi:Tol biopolymer transport system component